MKLQCPTREDITLLTKRGRIALKQVQKESKQALGRLLRVYGNTLSLKQPAGK